MSCIQEPPPPEDQIDTSDAFSSLLHALYTGVQATPPWRDFLCRLRCSFNCDSAGLTLRPARMDRSSISVWDSRLRLDQGTLEAAARERSRYAHLDPLAQALRHSGDIHTLDEVAVRAELRRTTYYRNFMRRYGMEYQLGMCIAEPSGWTCYLGLMSGRDGPEFVAADKTRLRALLPHLERALTLFATLNRNALQIEIYRQALDKLSIGTVILSGSGKVLEVSTTAHDIIRASPCLALIDAQLRPRHRDDRIALQALIEQAAAWADQEQSGTFVDVLRLRDHSGHGIGVVVRSSPTRPWYTTGTGPRVTLHLSGLDARTTPEAIVGRLFGLTRAEAELATAVTDGLSIAKAAQRLGLTESSARTYCKRVFAKTGTRRQAELVRLVLKSVAPLGVEESLSCAPYASAGVHDHHG